MERGLARGLERGLKKGFEVTTNVVKALSEGMEVYEIEDKYKMPAAQIEQLRVALGL